MDNTITLTKFEAFVLLGMLVAAGKADEGIVETFINSDHESYAEMEKTYDDGSHIEIVKVILRKLGAPEEMLR